jgi:hypothetical protein
MPRITVGNKEIVVSFEHGKMPCNYKGRTKAETDYTKCVILTGDTGCRDDNKKIAGSALVRRYYKDPTNRVAARCNALETAMKHANFTKNEREAIWNTIRRIN